MAAIHAAVAGTLPGTPFLDTPDFVNESEVPKKVRQGTVVLKRQHCGGLVGELQGSEGTASESGTQITRGRSMPMFGIRPTMDTVPKSRNTRSEQALSKHGWHIAQMRGGNVHPSLPAAARPTDEGQKDSGESHGKTRVRRVSVRDVVADLQVALWDSRVSSLTARVLAPKHPIFVPRTWLFDPRSTGNAAWGKLIMLCILYTCIVVPYEIALMINENPIWLFWMNRGVDFVFITDVLVVFNTAIIWKASFTDDKETHEVLQAEQGTEGAKSAEVLSAITMDESQEAPILPGIHILLTDRTTIAGNYARSGWLLVDIVSLVPLDLITSDLKALRLLRLLRLVRLLKIFRSMGIVRHWQIQYGFPFSTTDLLGCCVLVFFAVHWLACSWYFVSSYMAAKDLPDWLISFSSTDPDAHVTSIYHYSVSVYYSMMTLTTIGYGDVLPASASERWVSAILMQLCAAAVYAYIIAVATQIVVHMRRYKLACEHMADQVDDMG